MTAPDRMWAPISDAPRHYVEEVLRCIGLRRYFKAVYTIEDARYRGKPDAHAEGNSRRGPHRPLGAAGRMCQDFV